ncbi:hypothetical protein [Acinetobacter pittii]|uniref:Transglycosylase SLT domain-containing protein n=1 Tax=Acinetobacter pittii TaxID=48296 RepID=A0A6H0G031_ACIPI|nr:hypothetical protein [Acinetobacter pittii]QIT19981.1 hypothetical protein G8E09_19415 [Acinetobacter pittii]
MANVYRNVIKDYAVTVVGTTAAAQASLYGEGIALDAKGYDDVADQYYGFSTDPTSIATNLGIASIFHVGARYAANKNKPDVDYATVKQDQDNFIDAVDDAQTEADNGSILTTPESFGDTALHADNINKAGKQIAEGKAVKVTPTQGTPKPVQTTLDVFKGVGTSKAVYDAARANGLSDIDARYVVALAHFESMGTFSPTIKNKHTSATGVFQFIDDTWKLEGGTTANRYSLSKQIELGIKHTKNNIAFIEERAGVTLKGSQIYIPHLLGRGGALEVFKALKENPNQSAREVISRFSDNPDKLMRINGIKPNATISEAINGFTSKIDDLAVNKYGALKDSINEPTLASIDTTIDNPQTTVVPKSDVFTLEDRDSAVFDTMMTGKPILDTQDIQTLEPKHSEDPFSDILVLEDSNEFGMIKSDIKFKASDEVEIDINAMVEKIIESIETSSIPHAHQSVRVKGDKETAVDLNPDPSITGEWVITPKEWSKKTQEEFMNRSHVDKDRSYSTGAKIRLSIC